MSGAQTEEQAIKTYPEIIFDDHVMAFLSEEEQAILKRLLKEQASIDI